MYDRYTLLTNSLFAKERNDCNLIIAASSHVSEGKLDVENVGAIFEHQKKKVCKYLHFCLSLSSNIHLCAFIFLSCNNYSHVQYDSFSLFMSRSKPRSKTRQRWIAQGWWNILAKVSFFIVYQLCVLERRSV